MSAFSYNKCTFCFKNVHFLQADDKLLTVALTQSNPELLATALEEAETAILAVALTKSRPDLLAVALQDATKENLKVALTSAKRR